MRQTESFDYDYILKCCNGVFNDAFDANACLKILLQIGEYRKAGYKGLECSPAFYNTVCRAMIRASIMDVARIYDQDGKSISLRTINNYCGRFAGSFPDEIETVYNASDGTIDRELRPLRYKITPKEMACITKEGLLQKIDDIKKEYAVFGLDSSGSLEVTVSAEELFYLYSNRIKSLSEAIGRIEEQRNKRYAHNDRLTLFDYDSLIEENKVTFNDLDNLISLALDYTGSVIALLTGEYKAREFFNIDDLSNTLQLVRKAKQKE